MQEPVIVAAVRSPIGRHGGSLSTVRPDDLAAIVIRGVLERAGLSGEMVDDVFMGCTNQAGEDNRNVARMGVLLAGLPVTVPGATVNRLCGSGLEAVNQAAALIQTEMADVVVAGGVESMSRAPYVVPKPDEAFPRGNQVISDTTLGWRLVNPRMQELYPPLSLGETAEVVAEKFGIVRAEQDKFALDSQQKALRAQRAGVFAREIIPVMVPQRRGEPRRFETDEHPRSDVTLEKLAALKPVFRAGGTVTAGNSSGINDGAAALLLMSRRKALALGLKPLAKVIAWATAGVHPDCMGIGPVPATRKLLKHTGLSMAQIEVVELNEAFAAQSLACIKELGLDPARVNPNGGAIALGHPLGCSGARLAGTLSHELSATGARYGVATMCIGVGQGIATLLERCS